MKLKPACVVLSICMWTTRIAFGQDAPAQTPPASPQVTGGPGGPQSLPPPKFVPSEVNTGRGFSIEPFYWFASTEPTLRKGDLFRPATATTTGGNLDFSRVDQRPYGGTLSIPASKTTMVRITYFQAKSIDFLLSPAASTFFKAEANRNDLLFVDYRFSAIKASLDYLTYYWNVGRSELRLKTLWEMQRVGVTPNISIVPVLPDNSLGVPQQVANDYNIFLPTVGVGLEHTLGRHFRWEARGSGMTFGARKARLIDADASISVRFGKFELAGGGKFFSFKTSSNSEHVLRGTMFGPYVGLRYYWRKERPTAGTTAVPKR